LGGIEEGSNTMHLSSYDVACLHIVACRALGPGGACVWGILRNIDDADAPHPRDLFLFFSFENEELICLFY
jgi:hypothetical protein